MAQHTPLTYYEANTPFGSGRRLGARGLAAMVLAVVTSGPLRAHDFWIEPSTFRPQVASVLSARVLVGQGFRGDPLPRNDQHILRFLLVGPSGESPFLGLPGAEPAGLARVPVAGLHVIGYESNPSSVELDPEKLRVYIKEEGLEPFFHGDPSSPIRDNFSRCAKSLVLAGSARGHPKGYDRRLGFTLELVPEANPYALGKDRSLPVRLLREGKPLEDALVVAMERDEPEKKLSKRTDAEGRVRFELPDAGLWLVKSVFITPVAGKEAEWESTWASLTFEVPRTLPK